MRSFPERTVRLVESVTVNPEVRHLVFEIVGERGLDHAPGQYLCLSATFNGATIVSRCAPRSEWKAAGSHGTW
jgi:hypothetical protein